MDLEAGQLLVAEFLEGLKKIFETKKDIVQIIKSHDDWEYLIEIKDNAKGEPQVTIKARSDGEIKNAGETALAEYKRIHEELKK